MAVDRYTPQDTSSTVLVELDPAGAVVAAKEHTCNDLGEFVAFTPTGFIQSIHNDELEAYAYDGHCEASFCFADCYDGGFVKMPISHRDGACGALVELDDLEQPVVLLLSPGLASHEVLCFPADGKASLESLYLLAGNRVLLRTDAGQQAILRAYDEALLFGR